jgi:hypothetical protein
VNGNSNFNQFTGGAVVPLLVRVDYTVVRSWWTGVPVASQESLIASRIFLVQWQETPPGTAPPATGTVLAGNSLNQFYFSFVQLNQNDNICVLADEFEVPDPIISIAPGYVAPNWNAGLPMPINDGYIQKEGKDLQPIVFPGNAGVGVGTIPVSGGINLHYCHSASSTETELNAGTRLEFYSVICYTEDN